MAFLLKTAIAAAFLASALGAEIETAGGNVNVRVARAKEFRATRDMEQVASLFAVKTDVDKMKDDMKSAQSAMEFNKLMAPYVGGSISRIDTLVQATADVQASFKTVNEKMDQVAKDSKSASASQTDTLNKKIAALESTNSKLTTKIASDQKTFQAAVDKSVKDKLAAIEEKMTKLTKDTAAAIAKGSDDKMSSVVPTWMGGHIGGHLGGSGWFNMGRLDFTNAPNHLKRVSNQIEVLSTGIYNMHFRGLAHGGWRHCHYRFRIGSKYITSSTHHWVPGTWEQVTLEETYVVRKGQKIGLYCHGCSHCFHGSSQNDVAVYDRLSIKYVGQVGDKCSGPFCKGN